MKNFILLRLLAGAMLVTSLSGPGVALAAEGNPSLKGKRLLYVGGAKFKERVKTDENAQNHLRALGFVVTVASESDSAAKADGQDIVVISASVSARVIAGKYRDCRLPVVVSEARILDDMGMSGKSEGVDFGDERQDHAFWFVNAPHPLQGGQPNGLANVTNEKLKVFTWGKPGLGATIIATIAGMPEKAVIFGYEKGTIMDGESAAPARRVMFFLDGETFDELNETGLKLFDAAISWAAGST